MIFGEPETVRFLAALRRLKLQRIRKDRQTNQAKQKVRAVLRKIGRGDPKAKRRRLRRPEKGSPEASSDFGSSFRLLRLVVRSGGNPGP